MAELIVKGRLLVLLLLLLVLLLVPIPMTGEGGPDPDPNDEGGRRCWCWISLWRGEAEEVEATLEDKGCAAFVFLILMPSCCASF